MELLQLRYFQVVALEEHITRAAEKLHVAQPSLSKAIKRLEDELGVQLFDRSGKTISLNENGQVFLTQVNIALCALSDAEKRLTAMKNGAYPEIIINSDACTGSLGQVLAGFNRTYPQIRLLLRKENTQINYPVRKYDLSIIMQPTDQPLPKASATLFEEDLMLAVPEGHPLCDRAYVDLFELKDEGFVSFQTTSNYRRVVTQYCQASGFIPNVVAEGHDWRLLCDFVRARIGIAIVPKNSWRSCYYGIKTIPIRTPRCSRRLLITWFDDNRLNVSSRLFVAYITQFYKELLARENEERLTDSI